MGTHPIFESDFDCLTEMNRLALPSSVCCLSAIAAARLWKQGLKDIGLVVGIGSAVVGWFCVWDLRRSSKEEYKKSLYQKRKAAWDMECKRPFLNILQQLVDQFGSIDKLKNPMSNQQNMMQFIQLGERALQMGDRLAAIKHFSFGIATAYVGNGVAKATQLIETIGRMMPDMLSSLTEEFNKDRVAIDAWVSENCKPSPPLLSRQEFVRGLNQQSQSKIEALEEDPIDDEDDEATNKELEAIEIEEVTESDIKDDEKPTEVTTANAPVEATEVAETLNEVNTADEITVQSPSPENDECLSADVITSQEVLVATQEADDRPVSPVSEIGDAPPAVTKVTVSKTEGEHEIEDEELE